MYIIKIYHFYQKNNGLVKVGRSLDQYDAVKYETDSKTVTKASYCGNPVILKVNIGTHVATKFTS